MEYLELLVLEVDLVCVCMCVSECIERTDNIVYTYIVHRPVLLLVV